MVVVETRIARSCGGRRAMETEKWREIGRREMVQGTSGMYELWQTENYCDTLDKTVPIRSLFENFGRHASNP
jgi:hypothetical protein